METADARTVLFEDLLLTLIKIPQANVDEPLWIEDGFDPRILGYIGPFEAEEEGNGTAVEITRWLRIGTATGIIRHGSDRSEIYIWASVQL
jgi:hypothetical protein